MNTTTLTNPVICHRDMPKAGKASGETCHYVGRGVATVDANVGHSPPDTDTVASFGYQVLEKTPAITLCCAEFQKSLTANGMPSSQRCGLANQQPG
jgi:hypothetical protein